MKFIKLTNCENDKAVLIRPETINVVWSSIYKDNKSSSYVTFQQSAEMPNLHVWETIDHIHGLLK